jgi:hypothetical protein
MPAPAAPVVTVTTATTAQSELVAMLERLASNPEVPVEKLERLLGMQERVLAKRAEDDFNAAMSAAQSEMRPVSADAENPQTRSRYASYSKLDGALRPIYTRHGFALSFGEADTPKQDAVRVVCYVTHRGGHTRMYHRDMPADGLGAKGGAVMTRTHALGAAQSYGMRYLLKGIFNVAIGEDDNDGNKQPPVSALPKITPEQAAQLDALIVRTGSNAARFLKFYGIKAVPDLPARDFDHALALLSKRDKPQ